MNGKRARSLRKLAGYKAGKSRSYQQVGWTKQVDTDELAFRQWYKWMWLNSRFMDKRGWWASLFIMLAYMLGRKEKPKAIRVGTGTGIVCDDKEYRMYKWLKRNKEILDGV